MTAYLDHAATTPLRPEAAAAVLEELTRVGNPSSLHTSGRDARRVVEEARERIAAALAARPGEVVLTGGGTEADNLAVKGLYWARREADQRRRRVLVSAVEHHAVLDPAHWLEASQGAEVVHLPVDATGRLDVAALEAELAADPASVALVSVMWANNEVGTVQPVDEVVAAAARYGVPVHSDAVQAVGALPVSFEASGLAAMTVSGHKLGGPVGSGALLVRRGAAVGGLVPVLHGGGQEGGVRSGSVDVAAARALGVAVDLAVAEQPRHAARLRSLRAGLVEAVLAAVPDAEVHQGATEADRLPGLLHVGVPGCEGDSLLYLLDVHGVECSTGSACTAGVPQPSHVLRAMGLDDERARGALRFSLGRTSTTADVGAVGSALGAVVARARTAGLAVA